LNIIVLQATQDPEESPSFWTRIRTDLHLYRRCLL
jgi:hypothetical protein